MTPELGISGTPVKASITFSGALYGWPYYNGVAAFIQRHRLLHPEARLYGASSGNVGGLFLATGIDAENEGFEAVCYANEHHCHPRFGPWLRPSRAQYAFFEVFGKWIPDDAHVHCSGRLHMLVTQLIPRIRRRVVAHYPNKSALLATMAASMAIPGHGCHIAFRSPALDLGPCLDGGLLGSLKDDDRPDWPTIRVSIFAPPAHLPKLPLLKRIDIGPSRPLTWRQMLTIQSRQERRALHQQGYDDAGRYFDRLLGQKRTA